MVEIMAILSRPIVSLNRDDKDKIIAEVDILISKYEERKNHFQVTQAINTLHEVKERLHALIPNKHRLLIYDWTSASSVEENEE